MANNSYKKIIKDGSILYICEYCNTVKEDTKEDIVNKTPSSVTELVSEAEEVPKYNEKNVATFNALLAFSFILSILVFIVVTTDTTVFFDDIIEIFRLDDGKK
ncbi:hypothetical protein [Lysinibacillus fusiformis]